MARNRNEVIYLRLTKDEKDKIVEKMKSIGMTNINDFVRKILLLGTVIRVDTNGLNNLAYEVNKVGNNINQITKLANQRGNVTLNDIDELNKNLIYINSFIENFYKKINKTMR